MIVKGKQTDIRNHGARITGISEDALIFEARMELSELDNIRIDISGFGELYAKVQRVSSENVLAAITFRPENFGSWLAQNLKK